MDNTYILLLLLATLATFCASEKCDKWERVEIFNATILPNGSAWDPDDHSFYPAYTYWKEDYNDITVIYGCPCKVDRPCLRKCCQRDEGMDFDSLLCISHDASLPWFRPNVTMDEAGEFRMESKDYFGLIFGNFCLGYLLEPEIYPEDKFYVNFTDGTLSIPLKNRTGLGPADYCLEYFPTIDSYLPFVCFRTLGIPDPPPDTCNKISYVAYPIGMLISILSLLISLSVYILLPSLRNLHGKCLMCHIFSLLVAYVSLAIVQAFGGGLDDDACTAFGFVIYLSILWSFFWLNIMCIDICVAFSSLRPMKGNVEERNRKKFLLYVSYAWGLPLLMMTFAIVMELHPDVPDSYHRPKFKTSCWFESGMGKVAYFIAPLGFIVFGNIALFLVTARNIYRLEKETEMVNMADSRRHDNKEDKNRFKLYIKLSIVMGVNWVMEIISGLAGGSKCIWLVTDLLNSLQGLFIFLIFVCKKGLWNKLITKYWPKSFAERS